MSLFPTKTSTSKEMYDQLLPHFILRQFHFVSSNNLRQKIQNRWRTRNFPGAQLLSVYDLAAGRLRQHPVPRVYKLDVFKVMKHATDVESKLKELEDEATAIVRSIHYGLQAGGVKLSRARLAILRKFLFVTHYRRLAVQFQEAGVEKKGQTLRLQKMDAWLEGLKYYLDTPHYDIIATGERLRERYGNARLSEMLRTHSYPVSEELDIRFAIEYEDFADNYFLGVWVVAEESEFVLSGDAFSHQEGLIGGIPCAHRVHVLTPRIAIILRRTCLHNPNSTLHSTLADVPISPPVIRYAKEDLIDILEDADPAQAKLVMTDYRTTPEAEQDSFDYSFTQLSPEQTYAVNEVIMMTTNLRYYGSVIFRQPDVMRETLNLYMASPNTFLGGKHKLFRPLLLQLGFQGNSPQDQEGDDESTAGFQLRLLFSFMIQEHISFPSAYTRAIFTFHMATATSSSNPISQKVCQIQDAAVDKLRSFLDPPLLEVLQDSSSKSGLIQSLANEESELFFSLITPLLERAEIDVRRSNDFFASIINEAAIIGVTYWLAEERPDVLRDVLSSWVHIWA